MLYTDEVLELHTRNLHVINQWYSNLILKKELPVLVDNKVQLDMTVSDNPMEVTNLPKVGGEGLLGARLRNYNM